jgi:hypothetical protein
VSAFFADVEGLNLFGIDATYDFGNGFRTSANSASLDGDIDALSVSGGYEVSQDMWIDPEADRINGVAGVSTDVIGLAVT